MTPDGVNRRLGRGISFGNALDAAGNGPEFRLRERYFDDVRNAGFSTVRLPVRWSVSQALRRDLNVVLNLHHYHELNVAPHGHRARFLALWSQIAAHYASWPRRLYFELLNEPRDAMTPPAWNELLPAALAAVRGLDPDRIVIVGPARMNDIGALPQLVLPADDRLAVTVHYYAPFEFTHQGASWIAGAHHWLGTSWSDDTGRRAVHDDLASAAAWAHEHGHPLFIGEFGTYARADMNSRQEWTRRVRLEAEFLGLSWCYWDFGTDFGAFDPRSGAWREPLRDALFATPDERKTG